MRRTGKVVLLQALGQRAALDAPLCGAGGWRVAREARLWPQVAPCTRHVSFGLSRQACTKDRGAAAVCAVGTGGRQAAGHARCDFIDKVAFGAGHAGGPWAG